MKRRAVLSGLICSIAASVPSMRALAQGTQPADLAGCLAEPGIALYVDLVQGRPVMTTEELSPGANWQLFVSPVTATSFLYPPDWAGQELYAATFSATGAPQWTAQQESAAGMVSARVLLPHSTALWEFVAGSLQGIALTIEQAVGIAEQGVLGDGVTGNRLCLYTQPAIDGGIAWFTAVEWNGSILLTNGTLYTDASGFSPFSVLTYYGMGGPRDQLEHLMRTVFLPIKAQLSGGGDEPTPTPTP